MDNSYDHSSADRNHVVKGTEVFVGGLAQSLTEPKIREVFSTCGEIVEVRMIKNQNGNSKGYCFVRFSTKEAALRAVKDKNGIMLEGRKIGVLPSTEQNSLFLGNLPKGWSPDEFDRLVRQVFQEVDSVNLVMLSRDKMTLSSQRHQNRGFGFVHFSSHAAAARAYKLGCRSDFVLGGKCHPTVKWVEEEPEIDPEEVSKVKVAFIRDLPADVNESFLGKLFLPFGEIEKVVLSKKGQSQVGFVHYANRQVTMNKTLETYLRCFINGQPKKWLSWLHWAEFSYNTSPHSSTKISPFQALYGRAPPLLSRVGQGATAVGSLEEMLQERDAQLDELKFQLLRAQQIMKANEDKRRRDVHFNIGDKVFLKLQPYRQISLARKYNEKLAPRFYGPYTILKKVGNAAYELILLDHSGIHPVFHVSQLKLARGEFDAAELPNQLTDSLELVAQPEALLDWRYNRTGVLEVLIKWAELPASDATWEIAESIEQTFPHFHLEDKVRLHGGGIAMPFYKATPWITYKRRQRNKINNELAAY